MYRNIYIYMYFEALLNVVELMGLPLVALSFSSLSLVVASAASSKSSGGYVICSS